MFNLKFYVSLSAHSSGHTLDLFINLSWLLLHFLNSKFMIIYGVIEMALIATLNIKKEQHQAHKYVKCRQYLTLIAIIRFRADKMESVFINIPSQ